MPDQDQDSRLTCEGDKEFKVVMQGNMEKAKGGEDKGQGVQGEDGGQGQAPG